MGQAGYLDDASSAGELALERVVERRLTSFQRGCDGVLTPSVIIKSTIALRNSPREPPDPPSPKEQQMRRWIIGAFMALSVVMMAVAPAGAASTTVHGTGSYEKLVVKNGTKALVFKIFAPGGECAVKYISVKFRDRDGTRYQMEAGCYPGAVWASNLVRGQKIVDCPKFRLNYNATGDVWTATIPRTCLKQLAPAVKVTESYVDDYTPSPGEVPATKYVAQG